MLAVVVATKGHGVACFLPFKDFFVRLALADVLFIIAYVYSVVEISTPTHSMHSSSLLTVWELPRGDWGGGVQPPS